MRLSQSCRQLANPLSTLPSPLSVHPFLWSVNIFFVVAIIFAFVGNLNANSNVKKQKKRYAEKEKRVENELISAGICNKFGQ